MASVGRLFRNPRLLSLATKSPAYPTSHYALAAANLPFARGARPKFPSFSTSVYRRSTGPSSDEPRKALICTCNANGCGHRGKYEFTQHAYERGVVIIQCPKCKSRHLIADHIGWFKETDGTGGGQLKNVEDFMQAKGEHVSRGVQRGEDGTIEYNGKA